MNDLRPCPFCGGEVSITYHSADNVFSIWHKYDGCKFIEPMYIDGEYAKSLSDARNIWNKRSVPYEGHCEECMSDCFEPWDVLWKAPDGTFKGRCDNCGFVHVFIEGHVTQYKFCPQCGEQKQEL